MQRGTTRCLRQRLERHQLHHRCCFVRRLPLGFRELFMSYNCQQEARLTAITAITAITTIDSIVDYSYFKIDLNYFDL